MGEVKPVREIIAHLRFVCENAAINMALIQTEDLLALCNVAEAAQTVHRQAAELRAERDALARQVEELRTERDEALGERLTDVSEMTLDVG